MNLINQLEAWGFSFQWWRGARGEYWAISQMLLLMTFVLIPIYPAFPRTNQPSILTGLTWGIAGLLGLMSLWFLLGGLKALGSNITPLPHPKDDGSFVNQGVYGIVRHPLYSSIIMGTSAYSCWQWSFSHGLAVVGLVLFSTSKLEKKKLG